MAAVRPPTPLASAPGTMAHLERFTRLVRLLVPQPAPHTAPLAGSLAESARQLVLTKAIRLRLVIAPTLGALALTFAFFEPTRWRRATLASAVVLLFGLSLIEWYRHRRYGLRAVLVPLNLILTVVGQLLIVSATGGLLSPAIPALLVMVMLSGLLTDRTTLIALVGLIAPAWWSLALLHASGGAGGSLIPALFGGAQPIERSAAPYIAASLYSVMLLAVARVGRALQGTFEELYAEGLEERDRALALHREQGRTLTTLSAEIAHELKNPLSSVKGLAALVAKESQGKSAERIAVLRKEVDRMQGILEEFLNFSRPLVPLALSELSLAELAREVVRLHEGSALERGVRITVACSGDVRLRGDPRKLRQVLINLLQNALDASPRDSAVMVRVEGDAERARVAVLDRGMGIPPEFGERVFEAGVTDKEHGSGLGLVVARSLARQHGGELTLSNGSEGGAIAELTLPFAPEETV